MHCNWLLVF